MNVLSELIVNTRKSKNISQVKLALEAGVSTVYLCYLERGQRIPQSGAALVRIAEVLELDPKQVVFTAFKALALKEIKRLQQDGVL